MENPNKSHEACCRIPAASLDCPVCGKRGRRVASITLDHHLAPAERATLGKAAGFCPNPACEVVYFDGKIVVRKGRTLLPVTQKDPGDDVHVCYCFGVKRSDIRSDLVRKGATDIPDRIKKDVADGRCDCERKNPQGSCCLGNVAAAVKIIQDEVRAAG